MSENVRSRINIQKTRKKKYEKIEKETFLEQNMDVKQKRKEENSLTLALRTLIKQKDEVSKKYKHDNQQLQELLIKQQSLLNKLNEDNMILNKKLHDVENSRLRDINLSSQSNYEELVDQNKSLQEQLLLSQYYGSKMLRELNETKEKLKKLTKEFQK